jgi:hypothetical protein
VHLETKAVAQAVDLQSKKDNVFEAEFRAKFGLEETLRVKTLNQIKQEPDVNSVQRERGVLECLDSFVDGKLGSKKSISTV